MTDPLDDNFRWEDIDQRLISPKTLELSEEMHKRGAVGERRIVHETAQSGNSAGYLPKLFEFHEQLTDEWISRLYAAYCEAWQEQNRRICPEFIRAVRDHAIAQLIAARKSSVLAAVGLRAWRTGEETNPYSLDEWERRMDRLKARWMGRLESWAVACEYDAIRERQADSAQRGNQPVVSESNVYDQRTDSQKLGRPQKLKTEFTGLAGNLWRAAMQLASRKRVSNQQLADIALRLDEEGYVPPGDYLEPSYARQVKAYNSRNSHSKVGPVKTWSQLISLADKDHLRGMRRLLSRCAAGGRTQEASLYAGSLCLSAEYRSQAGDYLRTGESAAESKGGKFVRRDGCGKAARRKSPKEGLSPLAWKSRKRRGIPTFPQPLRRLLGYIFNVSIAVLRVTSLNVLTRVGSAVSLRSTVFDVWCPGDPICPTAGC